MEIEDYINRCDVLVHFEDVIYSEYMFWFVHLPALGLWK